MASLIEIFNFSDLGFQYFFIIISPSSLKNNFEELEDDLYFYNNLNVFYKSICNHKLKFFLLYRRLFRTDYLLRTVNILSQIQNKLFFFLSNIVVFHQICLEIKINYFYFYQKLQAHTSK